MDQNAIDNLKKALELSPDNTILRLHLADTLLSVGQLEEAEAEYEADDDYDYEDGEEADDDDYEYEDDEEYEDVD